MKRMRTVTKEMAIPPYPMLIARLVSFACNEDFVVDKLRQISVMSPVGPTSPRHPHHLLRVHSEAGCWCSPPSSGSTGSPTHGSDERSPPPPQGLEQYGVKLEF